MWIQIPDKFKTVATTVIGEIKKLDPRGLWSTKERDPKSPTKTVTIMVKYGPTITIEKLDPSFSVQEDLIIEEEIERYEEPSEYTEYEEARKM
tara:strand:+ start:831 stop:1109 length:279 start_codon:yes stop_codon:yes gene_type:complete